MPDRGDQRQHCGSVRQQRLRSSVRSGLKDAVRPTITITCALDAIAAVVIGSTLVGALIIGALRNGLNARLWADGAGIIYLSHRVAETRKTANRSVLMRDEKKLEKFDTAATAVRPICWGKAGWINKASKCRSPGGELCKFGMKGRSLGGCFTTARQGHETGLPFGHYRLLGRRASHVQTDGDPTNGKR